MSCPRTLSTRASFQQDTVALSKSFGVEFLDGSQFPASYSCLCLCSRISFFWLSVLHFPAVVLARRHPVFLLPDSLQLFLFVERIALAFNGQDSFSVRHSLEVEGHFLFLLAMPSLSRLECGI